MRKLLTALLALWATAALAVVPQTYVGDVDYPILDTDTFVVTTAALTAPRTWTLPPASASCIGQTCPPQELTIYDAALGITSSNNLTIARQSGETINGVAANITLNSPGAMIRLIPLTGSNWQVTLTPAPGQIRGTNTNSNAAPGNVGELITATLASANAISLTSTTPADVLTLALTPGDWSCFAEVARKLAAATSVTQLKTSFSTSADTDGAIASGTMVQDSTAANVMAADTTRIIGPVRFSLATNTTIHVVADDTFTVDTNAGYGFASCRRVR